MTPRSCLEWSRRNHEEQLAILHEASKRPKVWLDGNYDQPVFVPMQNFVRARTLAQALGARAQAHMLLNDADAAYEDVRRINELRRIMETEPATLVAAMIRVAIVGLQTGIIEAGFAEGIWTAEHLRGFQEHFATTDLLSQVQNSIRYGERLAVCHSVETMSSSEFLKMFKAGFDGAKKGIDKDRVLFAVMPRGWILQNLAVYAQVMQTNVEMALLAGKPGKAARIKQLGDEVEQSLERRSPMLMLSRIAIPNLRKATETTVKNQTHVKLGMVASALERARMDSGSYPESLEALTPKYLENLPIDLITGKSFRYQKRVNGEFALYSPAWDGGDDIAPLLADANASMRSIIAMEQSGRDWIWKGAPRNPGNPEKTRAEADKN